MFGKTHTEEARQKISKAQVGKIYSNELRLKMSESHTGNKNHMFGKRILSDEKCSEIRLLYIPKVMSYKKLADKFGVSVGLIQNIITFLGPYSKK